MELEKTSMETSDYQHIKFSVLMSVYKKENPEWFRLAVDSVLNQTIKPTEVLIVQDGVLTDELYTVCKEVEKDYPDVIRYLSLKENCGLGVALQKGVLACKYELIARMDTDDVSVPDRFERQLKEFMANPDLCLCGGYIQEFNNNQDEIVSMRKVPITLDEITTFGKRRNPFNHMTVMFKKTAVVSAGNYQPFLLLEDYYLWYRMIKNKYMMKNIPHILVKARIGNGMVDKRGGYQYFKKEKRLCKIFYDDGYITYIEYLVYLFCRFASRILPAKIRKVCYQYVLR